MHREELRSLKIFLCLFFWPLWRLIHIHNGHIDTRSICLCLKLQFRFGGLTVAQIFFFFKCKKNGKQEEYKNMVM